MVTTAAPAQAHETPSSPGRRWGIAATVTTLGALALVVTWSVYSGAIHRAYSDDWAYLRIAHRFVTDGALDGVGWNDTSLLGQVFASRLISPITGRTVAGLRVISILAAIGSLVLVALLARRSRAKALWPLIPMTVVAMPGFASTVATYMTEQPALFAQLLCLTLGLVTWRLWQQSGRLPLAGLVGMALAGAWAGSIRQAAIAAPLAVLAALLTHPRAQRSDRRVLTAVGVAIVAFVLVLMLITPFDGPTMAIVRGSISGQVARIYQAVATLALFLLPVAIATGWFRRAIDLLAAWWSSRRGRLGVLALGLVVAVGGVLLHRRTGSLVVGNSLQQAGGYQGMDLMSPDLFSRPVWFAIEAIAAGALFVLLVLIVHGIGTFRRGVRTQGWRPTVRRFDDASALTRIAAIWAAISMLAALGVNLAYRAIYDRYLIPVIIGLALVALDNAVTFEPASTPRRVGASANRRWRGPSGPAPKAPRAGITAPGLAHRPDLLARRLTIATVALAPLLLLGVVAATDTQDLLDLRWSGGDRLVELGYQPEHIDAGFDWVGYHYPGSARPDRISLQPADYPPATYDAYFPDFQRCAFVSPERLTPPAGFQLVDTLTRHRLFGLDKTTLYLYGAPRDGSGGCLAAGEGP